MIPKEKQAAQMLTGMTLSNGWKVVKKIERGPGSTGGVYSCCYEVQNGDRKGFLKAFDYSAADKVGQDSAKAMSNILNAYIYEREILQKCTESNCKNVIRLIEQGNSNIAGAELYPQVEYLILEYADKGDVRSVLKSPKTSLEWKMRSIHQLAKGLRQIHNLSIAHQDIKPSNIVTIGDNVTKITDFGSAIRLDSSNTDIPIHLDKNYNGTWEYAPPELLYGELSDDTVVRRIGCDLYLLGSMIAFYFTNMSMTSLIKANLHDDLCWTRHANYTRYPEIKSYLLLAFEKALIDVEHQIPYDDIKDEVMLCLRYLCNPDPKLRGHKKNFLGNGHNYNLERFISIFNSIALKLKYKTGK